MNSNQLKNSQLDFDNQNELPKDINPPQDQEIDKLTLRQFFNKFPQIQHSWFAKELQISKGRFSDIINAESVSEARLIQIKTLVKRLAEEIAAVEISQLVHKGNYRSAIMNKPGPIGGSSSVLEYERVNGIQQK